MTVKLIYIPDVLIRVTSEVRDVGRHSAAARRFFKRPFRIFVRHLHKKFMRGMGLYIRGWTAAHSAVITGILTTITEIALPQGAR